MINDAIIEYLYFGFQDANRRIMFSRKKDTGYKKSLACIFRDYSCTYVLKVQVMFIDFESCGTIVVETNSFW